MSTTPNPSSTAAAYLPLAITAEDDPTLVAPANEPAQTDDSRECCLVQIYPADVVDGLLLLETPAFSIGRESSNDLQLLDSSVSRQHAELQRCEHGYQLHDLGSTNGSLVNGNRIDHSPLDSGDTIQLGCYMFKFLSAGSVESQYHETVYSAMTRDALTGAVNRRYLLEAMKREIARCVRQHRSLVTIMVDIDHFKNINDSHGHLVGDEVLCEFGRRMSAECRDDDLLARYGGEEFCLVLSDTDSQAGVEMAERCRKVIADTPFQTAAGGLSVTASFGVEIFAGQRSESPLDLIHRADVRLYNAKTAGRNRVVYQ